MPKKIEKTKKSVKRKIFRQSNERSLNVVSTINSPSPVKLSQETSSSSIDKLSIADKSRKDNELKLIESTKSIKNKVDEREIRPLPDQPIVLSTLEDAVQIGVKQSNTLVLDWSTSSAKRIGSICKVYWDGESAWYYARILNYDSHFDKHYVFYEEDNTAEWISLKEETTLVAEEIILSKHGKTVWPSIRFWASSKARTKIKDFKFYKQGGDYIEFFDEDGLGVYSFVTSKSYLPLTPVNLPRQPSKRFEAFLEAARKEEMQHGKVVRLVQSAIRELAFERLSCNDWIGLKVFASTCRVSSNHYSRDPTISGPLVEKCLGTISEYCPNLDKHLIIFDDDTLQPKWVSCNGLYRNRNAHNRPEFELYFMSNSLNADDDNIIDSSDAYLRTQIPLNEDENLNPRDCRLCRLGESDKDVLEPQYDFLQTCCKCNISYHQYCMPSYLFPYLSKLKKQFTGIDNNGKKTWWCWKCITCEFCTNNIWSTPHMLWNLKYANVVEDINRDVLICGECLESYHYNNNYCPICGVLYPLDHHVGDQCSSTPKKLSESSKQTSHSRDNNSSSNSSADGDILSISVSSVAQSDSFIGKSGPASIISEPSETTMTESTNNNIAAVETEVTANIMNSSSSIQLNDDQDTSMMVQCNECSRWIHAMCDGIDKGQYDAITQGKHPVWGDEYLCPLCRVSISTSVMNKLHDLDTHGTFALPVTDAVAPNYSEIIRNPMDLQTMANKARRGQYKSLQSLRIDFDLMCLNAITYNRSGTEYWNDAILYRQRAIKSVFNGIRRKTMKSAYGLEFDEKVASVQDSNYDITWNDSNTDYSVQPKSEERKRKVDPHGGGLFEYVGANGNPWKKSTVRGSRGRNNPTPTEITSDLNQLPTVDTNSLSISQSSVNDSFISVDHNSGVTGRQQSQGYISTMEAVHSTNTAAIVDISNTHEPVNGDTTSNKSQQSTKEGNRGGKMKGQKTNSNLVNDVDNTMVFQVIVPSLNKVTKAGKRISFTSEIICQPVDSDYIKSQERELVISTNITESFASGETFQLSDEIRENDDEDEIANKLHYKSLNITTDLLKSSSFIPNSYFACSAVMLPIDTAFLSSFLDTCLICASSDAQQYFLYCMDCGEAFHSFCVDVPLREMVIENRRNWRCSNCKVCEICGDISDEDINNLIYCDKCDIAFHTMCLTPPMALTSDNQLKKWYCMECVDCKYCRKVVSTSTSSTIYQMNLQQISTDVWKISQDAISKTVSESWGTTIGQCFTCAYPLTRELRNKQILENIVIDMTCHICKSPCDRKLYLQCTQCLGCVHPTCCDSKYQHLQWIKPASMKDWVCSDCQALLTMPKLKPIFEGTAIETDRNAHFNSNSGESVKVIASSSSININKSNTKPANCEKLGSVSNGLHKQYSALNESNSLHIAGQHSNLDKDTIASSNLKAIQSIGNSTPMSHLGHLSPRIFKVLNTVGLIQRQRVACRLYAKQIAINEYKRKMAKNWKSDSLHLLQGLIHWGVLRLRRILMQHDTFGQQLKLFSPDHSEKVVEDQPRWILTRAHKFVSVLGVLASKHSSKLLQSASSNGMIINGSSKLAVQKVNIHHTSSGGKIAKNVSSVPKAQSKGVKHYDVFGSNLLMYLNLFPLKLTENSMASRIDTLASLSIAFLHYTDIELNHSQLNSSLHPENDIDLKKVVESMIPVTNMPIVNSNVGSITSDSLNRNRNTMVGINGTVSTDLNQTSVKTSSSHSILGCFTVPHFNRKLMTKEIADVGSALLVPPVGFRDIDLPDSFVNGVASYVTTGSPLLEDWTEMASTAVSISSHEDAEIEHWAPGGKNKWNSQCSIEVKLLNHQETPVTNNNSNANNDNKSRISAAKKTSLTVPLCRPLLLRSKTKKESIPITIDTVTRIGTANNTAKESSSILMASSIPKLFTGSVSTPMENDALKSTGSSNILASSSLTTNVHKVPQIVPLAIINSKSSTGQLFNNSNKLTTDLYPSNLMNGPISSHQVSTKYLQPHNFDLNISQTTYHGISPLELNAVASKSTSNSVNNISRTDNKVAPSSNANITTQSLSLTTAAQVSSVSTPASIVPANVNSSASTAAGIGSAFPLISKLETVNLNGGSNYYAKKSQQHCIKAPIQIHNYISSNYFSNSTPKIPPAVNLLRTATEMSDLPANSSGSNNLRNDVVIASSSALKTHAINLSRQHNRKTKKNNSGGVGSADAANNLSLSYLPPDLVCILQAIALGPTDVSTNADNNSGNEVESAKLKVTWDEKTQYSATGVVSSSNYATISSADTILHNNSLPRQEIVRGCVPEKLIENSLIDTTIPDGSNLRLQSESLDNHTSSVAANGKPSSQEITHHLNDKLSADFKSSQSQSLVTTSNLSASTWYNLLNLSNTRWIQIISDKSKYHNCYGLVSNYGTKGGQYIVTVFVPAASSSYNMFQTTLPTNSDHSYVLVRDCALNKEIDKIMRFLLEDNSSSSSSQSTVNAASADTLSISNKEEVPVNGCKSTSNSDGLSASSSVYEGNSMEEDSKECKVAVVDNSNHVQISSEDATDTINVEIPDDSETISDGNVASASLTVDNNNSNNNNNTSGSSVMIVANVAVEEAEAQAELNANISPILTEEKLQELMSQWIYITLESSGYYNCFAKITSTSSSYNRHSVTVYIPDDAANPQSFKVAKTTILSTGQRFRPVTREEMLTIVEKQTENPSKNRTVVKRARRGTENEGDMEVDTTCDGCDEDMNVDFKDDLNIDLQQELNDSLDCADQNETNVEYAYDTTDELIVNSDLDQGSWIKITGKKSQYIDCFAVVANTNFKFGRHVITIFVPRAGSSQFIEGKSTVRTCSRVGYMKVTNDEISRIFAGPEPEPYDNKWIRITNRNSIYRDCVAKITCTIAKLSRFNITLYVADKESPGSNYYHESSIKIDKTYIFLSPSELEELNVSQLESTSIPMSCEVKYKLSLSGQLPITMKVRNLDAGKSQGDYVDDSSAADVVTPTSQQVDSRSRKKNRKLISDAPTLNKTQNTNDTKNKRVFRVTPSVADKKYEYVLPCPECSLSAAGISPMYGWKKFPLLPVPVQNHPQVTEIDESSESLTTTTGAQDTETTTSVDSQLENQSLEVSAIQSSTSASTAEAASSTIQRSSSSFNIEWFDHRLCCFCKLETNAELGRLLGFSDGLVAHVNCIRWSNEVFERQNVLINASRAKERALRTRCFYCQEKGATVSCRLQKCKRNYHLKCAMASQCTFIDTKLVNDPYDTPHNVYSTMVCPEHYVSFFFKTPPSIPSSSPALTIFNAAFQLRNLGSFKNRVIPDEPLRPLLTDSLETTEAVYFADIMSQRRSDFAVRSGAVVVHSTGSVKDLPELPSFYNKDFIYPHKYCVSRIYWSMLKPWERAVYIMDILRDKDLESMSDYQYILNHLSPQQSEGSRESEMPFNSAYNVASPMSTSRLDVGRVHSIITSNSLLNSPMSPQVSPQSSRETNLPPCTLVANELIRQTNAAFPLSAEQVRLLQSLGLSPSQAIWPPDMIESNTSTDVDPIEVNSTRRESTTSFGISSNGHRKPVELPLFRVRMLEGARQVNEDNTDPMRTVLYTRSLEDAYCIIMSRVLIMRVSITSSTVASSQSVDQLDSIRSKYTIRLRLGSYGLNTHQFFGLSLPFVRNAIERLPESVLAMVDPDLSRRYLPSYRLPTYAVVKRMYEYVASQKDSNSSPTAGTGGFGGASRNHVVSVEGSIRAAPVNRYNNTVFHSKKKIKSNSKSTASDDTKNINKRRKSASTDDTALTNDAPENMQQIDHQERIENQRQINIKYNVLCASYLENPYARLSVRKSDIHGYGLYAKTIFNKDDMIVEYIGQKIRQTVADKREILYEEEGVGSCYLFRQDKDAIIDATRSGGMARFINHCCEPNAYAKIITTLTKPVANIIPKPGMFTLSKSASKMKSKWNNKIDRKETYTNKIANTATIAAAYSSRRNTNKRLHSSNYCDECDEDFDGDISSYIEEKHIVIFAARDIDAGEEITYDYKFPLEDTNKLKCLCKATKCIGFMN